ncbi:ABC transporter substrate-binding protein [Bradyrhizobium guangzhouense]|uniref:ABC transporter ATP-binding protein n=1 Tax=Bradyrhizobium guangzhouense TaxID=1325095 RepID=A0AAE5X531_9BRAD|nr:ABC transporter substrate-binding protein [Bradyrhizobium guangzhouense]QAU48886.1 ABC transporter ATP-binding protein [Bradyrhizobium guangzhouense]RXH06896.1 carbohydrate ABC transporter substrate-binding protein [Bradyrhizobium guangzhouense]
MSGFALSRRSLIGAGIGGATLVGLGGLPAAAGQTRLRMFWWGAKERAERTDKVNQLYLGSHPDMTIASETLGWTDYWARLATQTAGRNAPDVLQMDYRYIFEYARRGALLPLDAYVPKALNLSDFSPAAVDSGKVDGKIYGVSLGLNSTAMVYDKGLIQSLGLKEPVWNMTWNEIGDLAAEITKAAKRDGFTGMEDGGGNEPLLEVWLAQRGKSLYTAEGKVGYDDKDMTEWLAFWSDMRKRGASAAPDVQALDRGEIDSNLLSLGKIAMTFAHSNQLVGFQAINKSKLGLSTFPDGGQGAKPGQYLKPAMMWSVSAQSKQAEAAVQLVSYFIADTEAGKLLGVERGVPASSAVRNVVTPMLDDLGRAMVDYISLISDKVGPLPPPPPRGAGEIQAVLRRVNEQVGFGRLTPADGAKQFVAEASAVLARG